MYVEKEEAKKKKKKNAHRFSYRWHFIVADRTATIWKEGKIEGKKKERNPLGGLKKLHFAWVVLRMLNNMCTSTYDYLRIPTYTYRTMQMQVFSLSFPSPRPPPPCLTRTRIGTQVPVRYVLSIFLFIPILYIFFSHSDAINDRYFSFQQEP